ncbi:hypothetical protein DFH11DRAFT_1725739 [Phellopilus nigrolimitatus]|nr:hypothetical protein DFH11DRAFT_1725739 [Phellopilus nigrolimitatus]
MSFGLSREGQRLWSEIHHSTPQHRPFALVMQANTEPEVYGLSQAPVLDGAAENLSFAWHSTWSNILTTDQPGTGRTLGKLIGFLGKRLEDWMGALASKYGFGPSAALTSIMRYGEMKAPASLVTNRKAVDLWEGRQRWRIFRKCKRLFKYTRSSEFETQSKAFSALQFLAHQYPTLRATLRTAGAEQQCSKFVDFISSRNDQYTTAELNELASMSAKLLEYLQE